MTQTAPNFPTEPKKPSRFRTLIDRISSSSLMYLLIGGCVLITAVGISAAGGAVAGQKEQDFKATQTTTADISVQFDLAAQDVASGRYGLAAERLQWILARAPEYPGAADLLQQAQAFDSGVIGTPTPTIIAAASDTDLESMYAEAQQFIADGQLENAIFRLQEIQTRDPNFKEAEVKETLFSALKTLGLSYIRGERIEEGIILLDQAAEIRPLDDPTQGEIYLATLYLTGRSYLQLNWAVAIQNFQAAYDFAPDYRDTATQLVNARVAYGDILLAQGAGCEAAQQFEAALLVKSDAVPQDKLELAQDACTNPSGFTPATVTPGGPTLTPSPTSDSTQGITGIPTPRPTRTPTPTSETP